MILLNTHDKTSNCWSQSSDMEHPVTITLTRWMALSETNLSIHNHTLFVHTMILSYVDQSVESTRANNAPLSKHQKTFEKTLTSTTKLSNPHSLIPILTLTRHALVWGHSAVVSSSLWWLHGWHTVYCFNGKSPHFVCEIVLTRDSGCEWLGVKKWTTVLCVPGYCCWLTHRFCDLWVYKKKNYFQ